MQAIVQLKLKIGDEDRKDPFHVSAWVSNMLRETFKIPCVAGDAVWCLPQRLWDSKQGIITVSLELQRNGQFVMLPVQEVA